MADVNPLIDICLRHRSHLRGTGESGVREDTLIYDPTSFGLQATVSGYVV